MSEYNDVYIFTKRTNLIPWAQSQSDRKLTEAGFEHYAKERDVQLILLVRYENEKIAGRTFTHCICKIKCPVNPLPIKGEFEAVSSGAMAYLLRTLGWNFKEKYSMRLFD